MTSISISCGCTGSSERRPGSSRRPAALPAIAARLDAEDGR